MKILIVDDSIAVHEKFRGILVENGFEVFQALDGIDGIKKAVEHLPDLILMDINMPGMSGLEAARILKATRATAGIPISMFTTEDERDSIVTAVMTGVKDYIIKTMEPAAVLERIRSVLKGGGGRC